MDPLLVVMEIGPALLGATAPVVAARTHQRVLPWVILGLALALAVLSYAALVLAMALLGGFLSLFAGLVTEDAEVGTGLWVLAAPPAEVPR